MPPADPLGSVLRLWALVLATLAVFAIWPGIDLAVSGLFHVPGQGFPIADVPWIERLRLSVWNASIILVAGALALLPFALWRRGPVLRLDARDILFILALYVTGPGLLVEGLLKGHWGRARPADVTQFGGTLTFTAPHEFADQCLRNCSLSSGEVAGATALAVSLTLILARWRPALPASAVRLLRVAIPAIPVLVAVQRVAAGRHFLSDVILSALFVLLLAAALSALLRLRRGAGQGGPAGC